MMHAGFCDAEKLIYFRLINRFLILVLPIFSMRIQIMQEEVSVSTPTTTRELVNSNATVEELAKPKWIVICPTQNGNCLEYSR